MKKLLILLIITIILSTIKAEGYEYYSDLGLYYKHHREKSIWNEARKICLSENATLAMPRDYKDVNVLKNIFGMHTDFIYVGFHRFFSPNEYISLTGKALQYYHNNWDTTEPWQGNTEDCIGLRRDGVIHDFLCGDKLQFVCQREDPDTIVHQHNNDCKSDDTEYRYSVDLNKCYKIHMNARRWSEARAICSAEGGNLAIIKNVEEREFLIKMFNERKYTARYTKHPNLAYIGIHELFEKGNFMTIDDEKLSDLTYYDVHQTNSRPGENCATLNKNTREVDSLDCQISAFFICEQPPVKKGNRNKEPSFQLDVRNGYADYSHVVYRKDYTLMNEYAAFYKVHTIKQNYSDALTTCIAEGADMWVPSSRQEIDAVFSLVKSNVRQAFIGLHDMFSEGQFVTLDGRSIDQVYHNWDFGEPNDNFGVEDCVVVKRGGKYNDGQCSTKEPFVCRKGADSVTQNIVCETYDLAYFYKTSLDRCYKFHATPRKWRDAFRICRAEEADLAIINSDAESQMLTAEFAKYPASKLLGNFDKGIIHLGFHDMFNEGVYLTVEGKSIHQTGFDKWAANQPDNYNGDEHCGSMFRDGFLNDVNCENMAMFVCEKKLSNPILNSDLSGTRTVSRLPDS